MAAKYAQHFLSNRHAAQRIVEALGLNNDDAVVEIGPGKGALTGLLPQAATVIAIEVDSSLSDFLKKKFQARPDYHVMNQDVLEFSFDSLSMKFHPAHPFKVVGNLPYNLTSPILRKLSDWSDWSLAIVMVQKEVGDRLVAHPGEGDYGALTVGMNLTCTLERVFDLSEDSFSPPPRVKSTVVKLLRRPAPLSTDIPGTQRVIQAAFQQRRKTLLNSLSHGLHMEKTAVQSVLERLKIEPGLRPERLSVEKFISLAKELKPLLSS